MDIQLGFSTGCLHKCVPTLREQFGVISDAGCRAVELNALRINDFRSPTFEVLDADDLAKFNYISLHTPKSSYGKNAETDEIFNRTYQLRQRTFFDQAVFHPDQVVDADFSIFDCPGFSVALENMDSKKSAFKTADEFEPIFKKYPNLSLVLDVNHAFTNDPTMLLAAQFRELFSERIVQVHLSGAGYHEPLFKTKQSDIVNAIRGLDVPIIVESVFEHRDELLRERDYILKILRGQ